MALFVKKYQNKNENMPKAYNKWYGRAVIIDEVRIEELSNEIQENCTVKRSDILAVLSELGPAIKKAMQNSMKVRIPYLGSFRLAVNTTGTYSADEFDVRANLKRVKVVFYPETKIDNGRTVKELTRGVKVAELPKNLATLTDSEENGEEQQP